MWKRRLLGPAAVSWLLVSCAQAVDLVSPSEYTGKRVISIRFEPPNQPLTPAQLATYFPIKSGAVLTPTAVRSAVKNLYATGRYADVEIEGEPAGGGMALIVRTVDQWFVGPVEVRGKIQAPPNLGQLANATQLQLGQPFSDEDLRGAVQGMQSLLERNGLYGVAIQSQISRDEEHQQVEVTFLVQLQKKRARLTTPTITGDTRMPVEKVASATKYKGWFRWKPATNENVQAGVRNVRAKYNKQDRLTSQVRLTRRDYDVETNRVKPALDVNGGPKTKIKATGAKVSKGKLQEYVPVFDEQTVNRDLLVQGATNLHDYFQSQGYFDVQVDFKTEDINADQQQIVYVLELGERHKLVNVTVEGNKFFRTEDIRERMFLQPAGFIRLRHGRYSQVFVRRDSDAIKALYHSNGFRDVKITDDSIDDYKGKKGDVAVIVRIVEGPQYFVSGFRLDGVQQLNAQELTSHLASTPGEPFSENNVALDRDYIIRAYQSAGFPDVAFDWKMTPGPAPHQFNVQYIVTEGMRQYVRDLLISGLNHTRRKLVDPAIQLHPGDPLSWTEMAAIQRNLYDLGIFDKVDMAIQNPDGATREKYVLYHMEEGHRYSVAVGAGAEIARIGGSQTSLDNPQGQTGFSPRGSFEVSRADMFGLGHSLNFKSRFSSLGNLVSLNYLAPRYRNVEGRNISVTALYSNQRDVRTFSARRLEAAAQLSQKLSKPTTVFWRFTYRDTKVDPSTLKINPLLIPLYSQPALIGLASMNLIQDRRDNPANAHRGIYNTIDAGISSHVFGSRQNFGKLLLRNSYYRPIHGDIVLASNTEFGIIQPFHVLKGTDPTQYVPLPERFFGGGSMSERGYPDNQAGPRDTYTGFPIGGNALLFHSTEVRFPLIGDNIGGVVFHDLGNIYSGVSAISFRVHQKNITDFDYMNHAVGFGIRYATPLGPVRVDLAYSINPPTFHGLKGSYQDLLNGTAVPAIQTVSHFQFFFSIGQAF